MRTARRFVRSVADVLLLIGAGWHEKLLPSTAGSHSPLGGDVRENRRKTHRVFKEEWREVK